MLDVRLLPSGEKQWETKGAGRVWLHELEQRAFGANATRRCEQHAPALLESGELIQRHDADVKLRNRARTVTARQMCGPRCCIAPARNYFESHDFRCSSKNARTCSGSSAPRNSTPAGSGSGQKTLSGVGIFVGLASMIFLLYKPIIGLSPCFAPASDEYCSYFVALTAQGNTSIDCLNRIICLSTPARFSYVQIKPVELPRRSLSALSRLPLRPFICFADLSCASHRLM
jgi:hypothetical protein